MPYTQPIASFPWYDVDDRTSRTLDELASEFRLHELPIEDCRHVPQRAKYEEHEHYLFCVLKRLTSQTDVTFSDFDVFIGADFLITVHDRECALIQRAARRAEEHLKKPGHGREKLDHVLYFLLDEIVDEYLPLLDSLDDEGAELEDSVLECPEPE